MTQILEKVLRSQLGWKNLVLLDEKNRTVVCWTENKLEDLHLAICAENLLQFVRPQKNEIFITNDLSSGCLRPGQISFLFQVSDSPQGQIYGLYRDEFLPLLPIPPVPLYQKGVLSEDLFAAIFANNSENSFWKEFLKSKMNQLSDLTERIHHFLSEQRFLHNREDLFASEKLNLKEVISEKPFGSQSSFVKVDGKNVGKITVTLDEAKAHFDFSGQQGAGGPCLPSSLSSSLAFSAFSTGYQLKGPYHHSHFSVIQTGKSPRSFFSSPHRTLDSLPHEDQILSIESTILDCLESIHRKKISRPKIEFPSRLYLRKDKDLFEIEHSRSAAWQAPLKIRRNGQTLRYPEVAQLSGYELGLVLGREGISISPQNDLKVLHSSGPAELRKMDSDHLMWAFPNN